MPAQRQVLWYRERRLAHQHTVDVDRVDEVFDLRQASLPAVLELHPDLDRGAVRNVDGDAIGPPRPHHQAGRQHASPLSQPLLLECVLDGRWRRCVDAKRCENSDDGVLADRGVCAAPIPEIGGDAVSGGELRKPRGQLRHVAKSVIGPGPPARRASARAAPQAAAARHRRRDDRAA